MAWGPELFRSRESRAVGTQAFIFFLLSLVDVTSRFQFLSWFPYRDEL